MLDQLAVTLTSNLGWTPPLPRGEHQSWLYPIFIATGFVVAIVLACLKLWKKYMVSVEPFYGFILIGVPAAIFGANFGSCVLGEPAGKPGSEFGTNFGSGLAIEGGIIFTVIAACIYFPLVLKLPQYRVRDAFGEQHQVKRVSFGIYADAIMPCILIAQFLGRWGNYFNQEVYGAVVHDPGLISFLEKVLPRMNIDGKGWCQPLFLGEGLGNLAMFFILYFGIEAIPVRKTGDLAAGYLLWYGSFRLALEPLRDSNFYSPVNMGVSIAFIVVGFAFILINHLILNKVRDKKVFHTLYTRGPAEVFRMIGAGGNNKNLVTRYQDKQFEDCVRKPQEMIYYGAG